MSSNPDSRPKRRRIDAAAKAAFLTVMLEGGRLADVAAACGVTLQAFHKARKRDPVFAAGWRAAHAYSAAAERWPSTAIAQCPIAECPSTAFGGPPPPASWGRNGEERIVPNNRRIYQRRKMRHVRFDAARQAAFLAHFRSSCDAIAAAAAAGVCERTVYDHLRKDAGFAALFQAALEEGFASLEAEAVRQRLEAQKALRAAVERAEEDPPRACSGRGTAEGGGGAAPPSGLRPATSPRQARGGIGEIEAGEEFERVMKLLARWDRRDGRVGRREVRHGRCRAMSFEDAIRLLDKRLRALGLRSGIAPPGEEKSEGGARTTSPPEAGSSISRRHCLPS